MKIGKITKRNIQANKILKKIYQEKGITSCELRLSGCWGNKWLSFAHKKKRVEYLKCPEGLSDFNETILCCVPCHQQIEGNRKLTEYYFNKLRCQKKQTSKKPF